MHRTTHTDRVHRLTHTAHAQQTVGVVEGQVDIHLCWQCIDGGVGAGEEGEREITRLVVEQHVCWDA